MTIIPLSEGSFSIDKTKVFVPFELQEDDLQSRPAGSLLVEVQPFVVITNNDILLLDAGLGFKVEGELQVHKNLAANGIAPGSITKVLMSHLHKDHAGGVSIQDRLGHYSLAFPNATYYVQERELEFAVETGFPSFVSDELEVLIRNPKVELLKQDSGEIDNYISYELTSGHSPVHQVFWIKEGSEIIFFGGDEAPQYQQMKNKFVAKYDFNGKRSSELRQKWWQQGHDEKWTFLFYHDTKTPIYKAN